MFKELTYRPLEFRFFSAGVRVMGLAVLVGWLVSPAPQLALNKAMIMVGGLLASWLLSTAPTRWIGAAAGWFAVLAFAIAFYFLIAYDWSTYRADFALLARLGDGLDHLMPAFPLPGIEPNKAGGLLAMFFPFACLFAWNRSRQVLKQTRFAYYTALAFIIFALVMTSSRAAWFSLILGSISAWAILQLPHKWRLRASVSALALIFLIVLMGVSSPKYTDSALTGFANRMPGESTGESRLELFTSGLQLITDFPITGSGLQSFAAVYSHYILAIPHFKFFYSHNLYLDLYLELGILGIFSWLLVFGAATVVLLQTPSHTVDDKFTDFLPFCTLASIFTVSLHGLLDDPLINGAFSPFFFIVPGFAFLIQKHMFSAGTQYDARLFFFARKSSTRIFLVGASAALILIFWPSLLSSWHANLGAIQMAKVELADFPSGEWQSGTPIPAMNAAKENFSRALQLNPENRTANHRLGLLAMLEGDYLTALSYLQMAHSVSPTHRGIVKNLGYTYLWLENFPAAQQLLSSIPETAQELKNYQTWWTAQGNPELSDTATRFIDYSK